MTACGSIVASFMGQMMSAMKIREVHESNRPRERLLRQGAASLSNQELLAILLRTGSKEYSVLEVANELLRYYEKIQALQYATLQELMAIRGIGEVKAIEMLAVIELGKRMMQKDVAERHVIRSPEDAAMILLPEMSKLQQEHFVALFLNVKNQMIHKETIFIGSLNASIVHPREIFREAIKRTAASLIVAHNHPSGNPKPSEEDIDVTVRLYEAGKIVGIDLLDHLIIGDQQFISMKEKGFF